MTKGGLEKNYYEVQRRKFIVNIINRENKDPVRMACTNHTLKLSEYNRKVVGQPKYH